MEPSKLTFSKLLTVGGTHESYLIPKYQRPYSWKKEEWNRLLEDINEDANQLEGHYMGSLICVDVSSGVPGEPRVYEVIDGQQRLTTLSCLLIALWSKFKSARDEATAAGDQSPLDEDDLRELQEIMDDLRRKVVRERRYQLGEGQPPLPLARTAGNDFFVGRRNRSDNYSRLLPTPEGDNRADYLYALSYWELLALDTTKPHGWSRRRIAQCISYFYDSLPDDIAPLKAIAQRVNALVFIHIRVNNQADAFRLFESINNRGLPLSALDIIKNAMLATLERATPGSIDESFERWALMVKKLGQDTSLHESYLRHFYNAFQTEDCRAAQGMKRATRSTLIPIYEQLIRKDAEGLLDDLAGRATHYSAITQPADSDLSAIRRAGLLNLNRIEAKPSHQFLLYLFEKETRGQCTSDDVNRTIDLLARYFVRRNLTDVPRTNRLDPLFVDLIGQCEAEIANASGALSYESIRKMLVENPPRGDEPADDETFREALDEYIYYYNASMARYLLCHLIESRSTRENEIDIWRRNEKDGYVWTIEHVLPQGTLKPGWIDMLAPGDREQAETIRNDHADLLGNLTLSAYNSELSNGEFADKQKKTTRVVAGEEASVGYKNGLLLNDWPYSVGDKSASLATTERWDAEHIVARGNALADTLVKDFAL
ncbi:DUF262 domain-containing protein [Paraburkholderia strydomiana]|uniref:DUF262 domain-containing protein n=1 Tax=Paraburkholderia strydomiana TaxID=1245417 RepID=UPI0038BA46ED